LSINNILKRCHLGGRVLKTAVAVTLAVTIAYYLELDRISLAAIVAVFTVQRTFYHSILQSAGKLGSVLLGAVLGSSLGVLWGSHPLNYGLVTILVIIACLKFNLQQQVPIALVTAVYMITGQSGGFEQGIFFEQIILALLGAISALAVNYFFTPDHKKEVENKIRTIDYELRKMLEEISLKITKPQEEKELDFFERSTQLRKKIEESIGMAKLFREEQKFHFAEENLADIYRNILRAFDYFLDSLEEMYRLLIRMNTEVPQSAHLSRLLMIMQKLQRNALLNKKNPYTIIDHAIHNLEQMYDNMELPVTREEFKSRASLYHIFKEIKRYYRKIKNLPYIKS